MLIVDKMYPTHQLQCTPYIYNRAPFSLNLLDILAHQLRALDVQLIPQHRKCQVGHQQALTQAPHQGNGVKEVGIAATGIYPEVVERGAEKGGVHDGGRRDKRVPHEREQVAEQRQHAQEQARVRDGRIWLEDGEDAQQHAQRREGLRAHADRQPADVRGEMQPKDAEEELAERVKDFNEEVPPQPHVGRQVRQRELDAVRAGQELPRVVRDEERHEVQTGEDNRRRGDAPGGEACGGCNGSLRRLAVVGEEYQRREEEDRVHG